MVPRCLDVETIGSFLNRATRNLPPLVELDDLVLHTHSGVLADHPGLLLDDDEPGVERGLEYLDSVRPDDDGVRLRRPQGWLDPTGLVAVGGRVGWVGRTGSTSSTFSVGWGASPNPGLFGSTLRSVLRIFAASECLSCAGSRVSFSGLLRLGSRPPSAPRERSAPCRPCRCSNASPGCGPVAAGTARGSPAAHPCRGCRTPPRPYP